jgi:hypothetical protein
VAEKREEVTGFFAGTFSAAFAPVASSLPSDQPKARDLERYEHQLSRCNCKYNCLKFLN